MAHDSTVRLAPNARLALAQRKSPWWRLPAVLVTALAVAPHAHAQNTSAPANATNATNGVSGSASGGSTSTFNPAADISRAVARDTTDTAIQNNWNSIMRPPVQAKPEEKPADTPRRARKGITPGISTN
ncbi:hypothetical protein [Pandoraea anhela]|uniref:Uncharacterized protein n=1 Tax=Pandoraea anhela TaxID=2508295 RepID=A0A5E4YE36_9BURK|nr:hypothetical protein [Pandoraea anhela]VVE46648.1 hypothetical protein PAN31108_04449 [Pandoraea anhela]